MGTQRSTGQLAQFPHHESQDRLHPSASQNPCFWPGSQEKEAIEALKETCFGNGHTSEQLGDMLVDAGLYGSRRKSAQAHVRAALNPGKTEYFSPSELMAIMALTGNYAWLRFQCRMLGLTEPQTADPNEQLRIAREQQERHERLAAEARAECERLSAQAGANEPLAAWAPPIGAKFSRGGRGNERMARDSGSEGSAQGGRGAPRLVVCN